MKGFSLEMWFYLAFFVVLCAFMALMVMRPWSEPEEGTVPAESLLCLLLPARLHALLGRRLFNRAEGKIIHMKKVKGMMPTTWMLGMMIGLLLMLVYLIFYTDISLGRFGEAIRNLLK